MSTRVLCNVVTCKHRGKELMDKRGICEKEFLRLTGCSCDANNIVACSEFEEIKKEVDK